MDRSPSNYWGAIVMGLVAGAGAAGIAFHSKVGTMFSEKSSPIKASAPSTPPTTPIGPGKALPTRMGKYSLNAALREGDSECSQVMGGRLSCTDFSRQDEIYRMVNAGSNEMNKIERIDAFYSEEISRAYSFNELVKNKEEKYGPARTHGTEFVSDNANDANPVALDVAAIGKGIMEGDRCATWEDSPTITETVPVMTS